MNRSKYTISPEHKAMVRDLFLVSEQVLRKRRKQLLHLRFAKPAGKGWSFFKKKRVAHEALLEILHQVSTLHPQQQKGTIAHILSEIVNLAKKDLFALQAELYTTPL